MTKSNWLTSSITTFGKDLILFCVWGSVVFWLFPQLYPLLLSLGLWLIGLKHLQVHLDQGYVTHTIAVLTPIGLMWILYYTAMQAWWLADDPALLRNIAERGILPHFYQSDVWRSVSYINLTPWVIFSLGIDWHFFGLEPLGYYIHHLLSFSIVLFLAYWVLNLFFSPLTCSLTLSILVVSVPSANVAQLLMVRHYLEGLGLSLLAIGAYVKAVQTQQQKWTYLGSIGYLLATTAKEIYVPLVIMLPCLPVGTWQQRWKRLVPFIVVAGSYVVWRFYMLKPSNLVSGYSEIVAPKLNWERVLALPTRIVETLGWQQTWQLLILLLVSLIASGIIVKNLQRCQIGCVLLWIAATTLPVIPVLSVLDPRYLFLPFLVFCLGLALSLQFLIDQQRHYLALILGLSMLAVGIQSIPTGLAFIQRAEVLNQYRVEGEFILKDNQARGMLINPIASSWYYSNLSWMREHILKSAVGVRVCYDLCICHSQATDQIYQYLQGHLVPSKFSEQPLNCGNPTAELTINLRFESGTLSWQLGPYQEGQYYGTAGNVDTEKLYAIPTQGSYYMGLADKLPVVIKYVSPAGWFTYSPVLVLDTAKKDAQGMVQLTWQRH